ncbi:unnamed protein product, partial [Pleuronectes platessa]
MLFEAAVSEPASGASAGITLLSGFDGRGLSDLAPCPGPGAFSCWRACGSEWLHLSEQTSGSVEAVEVELFKRWMNKAVKVHSTPRPLKPPHPWQPALANLHHAAAPLAWALSD